MMMNRTKRFFKKWGLFIVWLTIGILDILQGNISRISYACVWILLLLEFARDAVREDYGGRDE